MNKQLTTTTRRRPRNPVVRLFSSIWFGIILLTLILAYASIGSALPQVRGAIEMTEMEVFQHWTFTALVFLFAVTLCVATWVRIRWTILNAGVLTTHSGLLLLTLGSVWYFWEKIEGDVQLISPRIEIYELSGETPRFIAHMHAGDSEKIERFVDSIGDNARFMVLKASGAGPDPVTEVSLLAQIGRTTQTVELSAQEPTVTIGQRFVARLVTAPHESKFYDRDYAAIFWRSDGRSEPVMLAPLTGLPLHRERFIDDGNPVFDATGAVVRSKRAYPVLPLRPIQIPTGWFEHWRLPIAIRSDALPFDIEVDGYLPYVDGLDWALQSGADQENPGLRFRVSAGNRTLLSQTLMAHEPARSLSDSILPFEFRWIREKAELDAALQPMEGPHELEIEIRQPPVRRVVSISQGQTIKVDGTSYELTVQMLMPSWPLVSPGFEGARTPVARIDVFDGTRRFNRSVLQRFPQFSQDIDEQGTRHKDPLDDNLVLRYRTCQNGWISLIAGPQTPLVAVVFQPNGRVSVTPLQTGVSAPIEFADGQFDLNVTDLISNARLVQQPTVTPLPNRRPNLGRQPSAIRMKLVGRGDLAGWKETRWCLFSSYPHIASQPIRVTPPGHGKTYELFYSRVEHDLGFTLAGRKLSVDFFPGRQSVERWRSDFLVQGRDGRVRPGMVETNRTDSSGEWTLFQSGAPSQDHWAWTILGVGNRKGIWPMVLGCILIPLGAMYAFYVKPILRRRMQQAALDKARAEGRLRDDEPPPPRVRELAEAKSS